MHLYSGTLKLAISHLTLECRHISHEISIGMIHWKIKSKKNIPKFPTANKIVKND